MRSAATLVKALVFVAVTGVLTALVGVTIGNFRFDDMVSYRAVFTNLSGLKEGVDVRAAGVRVGTVEETRLRADHTVEVAFAVSRAVRPTTATEAAIRYKNLTGDRYLDLAPPTRGPENGGPPVPLRPGEVIPVDRTRPALDLDQLFDGFKPLLQGLDPRQVNQLSSSLIAVFQGQSATVESLLANVASLTSTLADRDATIGRLIDDLNVVLGTLSQRRTQFSDLIDQLQRLLTGLSRDRVRIGDSLADTSRLAGTAAGYLQAIRPQLAGVIDQTGRVAGTLNQEAAKVDYYLGQVPSALRLVGRGGAYGSFFNFYLCSLQIKLSAPGGQPLYSPVFRDTSTPRCSFREGE